MSKKKVNKEIKKHELSWKKVPIAQVSRGFFFKSILSLPDNVIQPKDVG